MTRTAMTAVTLDTTALSDALAKMDQVTRARTVHRALSAAARPIVAASRANVQQPGRAGYYEQTDGKRPAKKQSKQMLTKSMGHVIRDKPGGVYLLVMGPKWPGGAHGHLVERGHRIAVGGVLPYIQREGWTAEKVWHTKLKTMVFKHGKPRRHKPGAKRGVQRGSARPFPFLAPAVASRQAAAQQAMERQIAKDLQQIVGG